MKKLIILSYCLILPYLFSTSLFAQLQGSYISKTDELLNIGKIIVMPSIDNIDGIYARPMDRYIQEKIQENHHYQLVEKSFAGSLLSPVELEANAKEVKRVGSSSGADAVLAMSVSKNRSGINIRVNLFSGKDGKLLATEQKLGVARYEINEIRSQVGVLLDKVLSRLPYKGKVLSRQGNRVTLDLGSKDGVRPDQVISVIQVIDLKRHPKFNFIVKSEKEVLGKIKLVKVDETLSFGIILSERDKDLIQKNAKLEGGQFVQYADNNPYLPLKDRAKNNTSNPNKSKISFGDNPKEWKPVKPPVFGAAQLKIGVGGYNTGYNTGSDSENVKKTATPSIGVAGELWLTPQWTFEAELNQGIMELKNPSSSGPTNLNVTTTEYNFNLAYGLLFHESFFGPKVQALLGFHSYRRFIDSGSPLSTTNYSGLSLGFRGSLPLGLRKDYRFGVEFFTHLTGKLTESPSNTGTSAKNTISRYSFFGEKRFKENIWLTGGIEFKSYSTNFSTGSISQRHNRFHGGLKYMF
jgi:hypothetical protein